MLKPALEGLSCVFPLAVTADINSFFEGDIILTPDQRRVIESSIEEEKQELKEGPGQDEDLQELQPQPKQHARKRAVVRNFSQKWRNGIVPYVFHSDLRKLVDGSFIQLVDLP